MPLSMKIGKTAVRFEWTDGEADTTVTVSADEEEETMIRKLRRVIALADPQGSLLMAGAVTVNATRPPLPQREPGATLTYPPSPDNPHAAPQAPEPMGEAALLAAYPDTQLPPEEASPAPPQPEVFGWGRMPRPMQPEPELPAHLAGTYEIIPPEERGE